MKPINVSETQFRLVYIDFIYDNLTALVACKLVNNETSTKSASEDRTSTHSEASPTDKTMQNTLPRVKQMAITIEMHKL